MSETPSNTPIMNSKPGPAGWLPVWIKAISQPNEQAFASLVDSPDATSRTAFIWIFIAGTISGIVQAFARTITLAIGGAPQLPIPGLEQYMQQSSGGGGAGSLIVSLITGVCLSPVAGIVSILFFALGVAIVQWIAKMFGGTGTFEKLAYALAAISVPFSIITSVLTLFSAIPFVGLCTGILSFGLGLYALFLQITAVKAVNRFGWGPAIGSVLIPAVVILIFCACVVGLGLVIMGPAIGNVFNQINQSLQSAP